MRFFEVYLYASGPAFDIEGFQALLPAASRGEVRPTYRMDGSEKKISGRYWCSVSVSVPETAVNEAALSQLQSHAIALSRARALGAEKIYLSLAMLERGEVSDKEVALSAEVQNYLDAIGAEADMDIPQI